MNPQEIENRLKNFDPQSDVAVLDTKGDGYHFDIRIASHLFQNKSRKDQHSEIMKLFQKELLSGEIHALSIKTLIKEKNDPKQL